MLLGPIDVPNRLHPVLLLLSTAWALAAWAKRHPGLASSHPSSPEQIPRAFTAFLSLREPDPCPGCSLLPWERWLRTDPLSARPTLWGREGAARGCGALKAGNTGARLRALRAGRVGAWLRDAEEPLQRSWAKLHVHLPTAGEMGQFGSTVSGFSWEAESLEQHSDGCLACAEGRRDVPVVPAGWSAWHRLIESLASPLRSDLIADSNSRFWKRAAITWHLPSLGALSQPQNGCGAWSTWWRGPGWVGRRMWR